MHPTTTWSFDNNVYSKDYACEIYYMPIFADAHNNTSTCV